jgi:hypothetical protein
MDSDNQEIPDENAEDADLTTADWIADVDRYYQDARPAERQPNEFTVNDWRDLMSQRRGKAMHRNQASNELAKLVAAGKVTKREAIINGKWGWLYSFRKQ